MGTGILLACRCAGVAHVLGLVLGAWRVVFEVTHVHATASFYLQT